MKPAVWFEREVLSDLRSDVGSRCTMLGPATATPDDPYAAIGEAAGIVASVHTYSAEVFDRAPHLRVVSRTGIGYDKVDVAAATERGIAVCNAPDGPTISTAEHTITLMLAAAKNIKGSGAELRRGGTDLYARHRGVELAGKTLGLIGLGRIARRVAHLAAAFEMDVQAYDPFIEAFPVGIDRCPSLEDLLENSDVVSVHVPLTEDTAGLVGKEELAAMKPGAIIVNTARGGLLDLDALADALDRGHLFAAGLDVTDPEPLPPDHPLLGRSDVVATPHVAAGTAEAKRRIFEMAFDQVLEVLAGRRPAHLVNPEVWV